MPLPEQDHELSGASGRCGAVADLAWPGAKVAVLTGTQAEDRDTFVAAGFTVFTEPFDDADVIAAMSGAGGLAEPKEDSQA